MPKIRMNGYVTFYEDDDFTAPWKARQAIVIQHGFGRNSEFWRHWVPMLAGDYRVIRRDLRGHGGSGEPGPSYAWSFDNLLRDLSDLCDALKLKDFHLLAESTGGMLGVGYAATRADRLRSLTLCATPKTIGSAGQKLFAFGRASWQSALEEMGSEGWARAALTPRNISQHGSGSDRMGDPAVWEGAYGIACRIQQSHFDDGCYRTASEGKTASFDPSAHPQRCHVYR